MATKLRFVEVYYTPIDEYDEIRMIIRENGMSFGQKLELREDNKEWIFSSSIVLKADQLIDEWIEEYDDSEEEE